MGSGYSAIGATSESSWSAGILTACCSPVGAACCPCELVAKTVSPGVSSTTHQRAIIVCILVQKLLNLALLVMTTSFGSRLLSYFPSRSCLVEHGTLWGFSKCLSAARLFA